MITKRAHLQFMNIIDAAEHKQLCITECFNIKTGRPEYVLCTHELNQGTTLYVPMAKLFKGNPNNEITPPGAAKYILI